MDMTFKLQVFEGPLDLLLSNANNEHFLLFSIKI